MSEFYGKAATLTNKQGVLIYCPVWKCYVQYNPRKSRCGTCEARHSHGRKRGEFVELSSLSPSLKIREFEFMNEKIAPSLPSLLRRGVLPLLAILRQYGARHTRDVCRGLFQLSQCYSGVYIVRFLQYLQLSRIKRAQHPFHHIWAFHRTLYFGGRRTDILRHLCQKLHMLAIADEEIATAIDSVDTLRSRYWSFASIIIYLEHLTTICLE